MSRNRSWFDDYEEYRLYQEIFGEEDDSNDEPVYKEPKRKANAVSKPKQKKNMKPLDPSEMMICEFCGCEMPIHGSCDVCGWDGKTPMEEFAKTPFDDKENFDQAFYDSIEMPKRPASAKKWLAILIGISLPFVLAAWPMIFVLTPMLAFVYIGMKGSEESWEYAMENPEWYKRMQYNFAKWDEWEKNRNGKKK